MFTLRRILPGGTERTQGPFGSVREAGTAASYVLHDNGLASKAEALQFAFLLTHTSTGETLTHEGSGYQFRIEQASE
jgi:hypothetical protein